VLEQRFDSLQRFKSRTGGLKGIEGVKEPVARRQGDLVNEILRRHDGTPGEGRDPTRERVDKAVQIRARCQTWAAENTRTTVTQREFSLTGGIRMSSAKMDCEL
jgi:hypothetical protein